MENDQRMLGPNGLISRSEFVRMIIQSLHSFGYTEVARLLSSQSGVSHQHPAFALLKSQILAGNWSDCAKTLNDMDGLDDEKKRKAKLLVVHRWIMEILRDGGYTFTVTELEIGTLPVLRELLVEKLESLLPTEIPQRSLESLVDTAIRAQMTSENPISLLKNRCWCKDQFPTKEKQVLSKHLDEVRFVKFSNNGKYLASASKDCTAIVWEVFEDDVVRLKHTLRGHQKPVSFVSWSPSDSKLLTCGDKEAIRLWNVQGGYCIYFGLHSLRSCAWLPDEKGIFYANFNPGNFIHMLTFEDERIKSFTGGDDTIRDFALTPNGMYIIIISSVKDILIRNLENDQQRVLTEESAIVSISVSEDSKFLMVSLSDQEIHIWDVDGTMTEPVKYRGHKQARFIIHSCFSGCPSNFVASGSEDSQVYIWNGEFAEPLEVLAGHSGSANCVSWNPKKRYMLASASDDFTIRIWGPASRASV